MNPEIKKEWTERLRSGIKKQGNGLLKRRLPDGTFEYCCLGVLSELVDPGSEREPIDTTYPPGSLEFDGYVYLLSPKIAEAAGLEHRDPHIRVGDKVYGLSDLNDGLEDGSLKPFTFDQIADLIDEQL